MKVLMRFVRRLASLSTRGDDEERLRNEIEHHLALQTEDNIRAGLVPAEARRQAVLRMGGVEATKEAYRDARGLPVLESLVRETRLAVRRLRMAPAFTGATILTLALGIGSITCIFTLVHAVLLRSLPVVDPDALYRIGKQSRCCFINGYSQEGGFSLVSYELYEYLRDHTDGFSQLAAFPAASGTVGLRRAGSGQPARSYPDEYVSGNYFTMFGVHPAAGRLLANADDRTGAPLVGVISDHLWRQAFGGDPTVVGSAFVINGTPVTIVGVTPAGFFGGALRANPPDVFLPLHAHPVLNADTDLQNPRTHWLNVIGRLRPGARAASVEAQMRVALGQWLHSHAADMNADDRRLIGQQTVDLSAADAGITTLREQYDHWLRILMLASGFMLLIVCANVANLMLVRGMQRRQQISLSMALGARPWRVMMQPIVESVLLALMGGAAGLAIAFAGTRLIVGLAFPSQSNWADVPIEAWPSMPVLLFAAVTSIATGLAFGMAAAWSAARVQPMESIRGMVRTLTSSHSLRGKRLVVCQTTLSLVLLSASGLLTLSLRRLERQPLGFETSDRTLAVIDPRSSGYAPAQLPVVYQRLHDALASVPAVASVGVSLYAPQSAYIWGAAVSIDGQPPARNDDPVWWNRVSAGYLGVMGTRIVQGRDISEQDTPTSLRVAVVNDAFARRFFGRENPIGRRFQRLGPYGEFQVVGVAEDARYVWADNASAVRPLFFVAAAQADTGTSAVGSLYMRDIVVRSRPGAPVSENDIRNAVAAVDPNLPVITIRSMNDQVASQFTQARLAARLMSLFGLLSLIITSIGLYGVVAYNAGRRTNEIGVRMALGATRRQVIHLVVRGALKPILLGIAVSVPLMFAAGRFLAAQLSGVRPYDLNAAAAAIIALTAAATIAAFVPAIRASVNGPLDALRRE